VQTSVSSAASTCTLWCPRSCQPCNIPG